VHSVNDIECLFVFICILINNVIAYPDEHLPHGNRTVLGIANTQTAIHVFALGLDGQLWHKFQMTNPAGPWTDWLLRATAPNGTWDSDPAVGVNTDDSIEIFIRESTNLDLWQIYQTDPTDPTAWAHPRECSCVDMGNCKHPSEYWNTQPAFPTSDITILNDRNDGSIQLYYRGFDGALFVIGQHPGTHNYYPPKQFHTIIE